MRNFVLAAAAVFVLSACNCGNPDVNGNGTGGGEGGGDGGANSGGGAGGNSGGGGGTTGACLDNLGAIEITPANQTVTVDSAPQPISFTATAHFNDGTTADVTSQLTWTAKRNDDTEPGTFPTPGSYQPVPNAGGIITISATDGCVTGDTSLTLKLNSTFKDPGTAITSRFSGNVVTGNATKSPKIVYPSDQTRFPRNIYKVLFQWQKSGNDYFRLTFEGPYSTTVVYSDGANPQCNQVSTTSGCTETDVDIWKAIAGSNAGEQITLTIDGVVTGDPNVYRSAPITIGFSRRDVKGAIFYWSTTAAGIRRASISDADPEDYVVAKPVGTVLPNNNGTVKCVACHTVSRSGRQIIAFTQATTSGEYVYNVTLTPPPIPILTTQIATAKGFGTFSPDDSRIVATVGTKLSEFLTDGGTKIIDLPVAAGTNPDWSPAGGQLVYSDKAGDSPGLADLSVIDYANDTWTNAHVLVAAGGQSNLFPSYSPDGRFIAYARGKGGHGDKTLQLWLAEADGGSPPVELVTANRIVNSALTAGQHENNMPTWAPPGDLHWVAFNSVRPYGVVFPAGGTQQIWVAAIDPSKLGQRGADGGMIDPSFPAFRFAFQGLTENNHRAYWTLDVRQETDAGVCKSLGSVCATGTDCCTGLVCSSSEIVQSCQLPPADAGSCIAEGATCDQTSGSPCCSQLLCDVNPDGGSGTVCQSATIN